MLITFYLIIQCTGAPRGEVMSSNIPTAAADFSYWPPDFVPQHFTAPAAGAYVGYVPSPIKSY